MSSNAYIKVGDFILRGWQADPSSPQGGSAMSEIPEDIRKTAKAHAKLIVPRMCMTMDHSFGLQNEQQQSGLRLSMSQLAEHDIAPTIADRILAERERCLSIIKSIEPHNPSEAHLLETIARRVRGEQE